MQGAARSQGTVLGTERSGKRAAHKRPRPARLDGLMPIQCLSVLCNLPGVVVYQRRVSSNGEIRYKYISEGAADLFGVSAEEILSNPNALFDTHGPDYRAKFRERLLSASKSLTIWDVEASILTPDGRKKFTHAIARPERQRDGSVLWTGIILDETRTREAVLESLSQGFLLFDNDDRLVLRNGYYLQLYPHLSGIAVPGAPYLDVVVGEVASRPGGPKEDPRSAADLLRRLEAHRNRKNMFEQELSGGRWLLVNEHRTSEGGTVVLYTETTELKRREAEAEAARLREEAARAENRAKSVFLATMSHEIRTPMNAVLGLGSTLLEKDLDPEVRQSVQAIQSAGESLLSILNDILDFSRLESGQLTFDRVVFSPRTELDNAISIASVRAVAKGLAIKGAVDDNVPQALIGDSGRIRQILLNLLTNAVKFTDAGHITVKVGCLGQENGHASIEWTVSDTGIGIAAEQVPRLFQDFVQADESIQRRFGGSGLGLSICKRIIEQMGGEIGVATEVGKGSVFRFRLKLPIGNAEHVADSDGTSDQRSYDELREKIAALGRPLRVLSADDNTTNQIVVVKMLQPLAVQVDTVGNGIEAVTAVSRFAYDLVLMDMRMPEMDGLQAARTIRSATAGAGVPIVAVTANAFADDVNACFDAGMNDFVVKPIRKRLLVDAILRVLRGSPEHDASPKAVALTAKNLTLGALPEEATMDHAVFNELVAEIGSQNAKLALSVFIAETDKQLKRFGELSRDMDREGIEREAHSLKGSAGNFGLRQVSALARLLQYGAARITSTDYEVALAALGKSYAAAREQCAKLMADTASAA